MGHLVAMLFALAALPATVAHRSTPVNAGMPVRIELVGFCSVSASDLNFGAYASNQSAPMHGQTTIQLQCSPDTVAEMSLDAGTGPGGNTKRRKMEQEGGTDQMDYGLYQDPGRTIHWGDKSGHDTLEVWRRARRSRFPSTARFPAGSGCATAPTATRSPSPCFTDRARYSQPGTGRPFPRRNSGLNSLLW